MKASSQVHDFEIASKMPEMSTKIMRVRERYRPTFSFEIFAGNLSRISDICIFENLKNAD
jgi:hypothetical protein